tara:strand:+ start:172 stop:1209 length:1038 start_codon:yes stop_codon:yes gene_type:complete
MKRIVLFDKDYQNLIFEITNQKVFHFWPSKSKIQLIPLFKGIFLKIINWNNEIKILYYYQLLKKLSPDIIISFQDTNDDVFKLSLLFKKTKFIIIQDSYRPPGFYGSLKLKKDDIFITYSPLIKFNLCKNEFTFKTFKYLGKKNEKKINNAVIFISQYRNYSLNLLERVTKDYVSKISQLKVKNDFNFLSNERFFLKSISQFFQNREDILLYKSAYRLGSRFKKIEEINYFKTYKINEISASSADILWSKDDTIFLTIDSTMIFELLSYGKKILIYPYREIYEEHEMDLHMELLKKKNPELFIEKDFSDFEKKYNRLKNINRKDYRKEINTFVNLPPFSLSSFTN